MAELHEALNDSYHPVIDNPYEAIAARMARILNGLESIDSKVHSIIERDVIRLGESVRNEQKLRTVPMPYVYIASAALRNGDLPQAREFALKQVCDERSTFAAVFSAVEIAAKVETLEHDPGFEDKLLDAIRSAPAYHRIPDRLTNLTLRLMKQGNLALASKILECGHELARAYGGPYNIASYVINRAQIRLAQNRRLLVSRRKELLEIVEKNDYAISRFGARIVLGQYRRAVDEIESAIRKNDGAVIDRLSDITKWPIVDLLSKPQAKRLRLLVEKSTG